MCDSGLSLSRWSVEPADRHAEPRLDLGRAAAVEDDVVHAPVVRDDRQPALGEDQHHRHVGPGGPDQPAQVTGVGEVLAAVDEDDVDLGGVEQRAPLGGKDRAPVGEQRQRRHDFGGRLQGTRQEQQATHGTSSGS